MKSTFLLKDIRLLESLKISRKGVLFNLITASGKDGDHFIVVSPTLLVSGYGDTEEVAMESFRHNLEVFVNDIMSLSHNRRDAYLFSLGFKRNSHSTKEFSKMYVDDKGDLCGLEGSTATKKRLEATILQTS